MIVNEKRYNYNSKFCYRNYLYLKTTDRIYSLPFFCVIIKTDYRNKYADDLKLIYDPICIKINMCTQVLYVITAC